MTDPSGEEPRKPSHWNRLALVATAALVLAVICTLPLVVQSLLVELLGAPDRTLYSLTSDEVVRSLRRSAAAARPGTAVARPGGYLNVAVTDLDEATRVATLHLSGSRTCTAACPSFTLVFASLDDDVAEHRAMPPSASVTIKDTDRIIDQTIRLPTHGQPSLYPFDTYRLWLGIIAYVNSTDGRQVPLHVSDLNDQASITLQAQLARLLMQPPVTIDPSSVQSDINPFDFLSVKALTFVRPFYVKALAVLLVLLITVSGCFAIFLRPIHDLFLGIGGVILGVWGVRSVIVQGTLPYVTAVDLALSGVILFLLLALAVRASRHFHRQSQLHLPRPRLRP